MPVAERQLTKNTVIERLGHRLNRLSPVSKERISLFIQDVVESCPNFGENEISQLALVLTKMEQSQSRYGLLDLLHRCDPTEYDKLHELLGQWTINMAKIVLDEIQNRLKLISELRIKLKKVGVDEVHDLQPLFERGLWMFGPQFETIEFTSNKGMTKVIRELFKVPAGKGSLSRPDFAALPDSSVGFYTRPSYDSETFEPDGVDHLVIIDLKTTGLPVGRKEKGQVWNYVKELREGGHLRPHVRVDGFVLGDQMEIGENEPETHGTVVKIMPILYDTILIRAERRLLNLHEKVKEAPFLASQRETLSRFLEPIPVEQGQMV